MNFEFIVTDNFARDLKSIAKKYPKIKDDLIALQDSLNKNPQQGDPLGKDCFKVRMAITGKPSGKRGGARVIVNVKLLDEVIYLLGIYDKADEETMRDEEIIKRLSNKKN